MLDQIRDLYQEVVFDHNRNPRNFRVMEDANRKIEGFNPLCGDEIRVDLDPAERDRMIELTGRRTVPQIFIGDFHVGGCDDLIALDRAGSLLPLLAGDGA